MHTMSPSRRSKLRVLQEREAAKARMGRLQMMLLQKLVRKYGSKRNANSRLNMEIEDEVKAFTARSSRQPTDEEFLELENTVRELRTKYCNNKDQSVCDGSVASSSNSRGKGTTRGSASNGSSRRVSDNNVVQSRDADDSRRHHRHGEGDGEREGGECCGGDQRDADAAGQDEANNERGDNGGTDEDEGLPPSIARAWRTFDVAKQIEYEAKEKKKAEKARLQKIRFREELEIHRTEQAAKKAQEEAERRQHMEEQDKRLEEFRMEQEAIKKRAADRHAEEKCLRQEQVKRLQVEKDLERQARLEKEMQDIELCKAQLQGEVDDMELKRRKEKERLAFIQLENANQKGVRVQRQRESDEADAKLLKEHRRRTDEEERKRADKLKERMKRYEDIGNFWIERGAGKEKADAEEREDKQTLKAARRKEEAVLDRERMEKEKRRLATMRMAIENKKVMAQKNALTEKRNKEDLEFAQRFINDSEAFRREELEKVAKRKAAAARYRKDLERQVEETKARRQHEEMNDTEFRLNSDLVKKLEADKQLVAQVRQRMQNAH